MVERRCGVVFGIATTGNHAKPCAHADGAESCCENDRRWLLLDHQPWMHEELDTHHKALGSHRQSTPRAGEGLGCTALSLGAWGGIQRRISQPGIFNPKSSRTAQRERASQRLFLPSAAFAFAFSGTCGSLCFMFELRPPSAIPQKCVLRPKELYYALEGSASLSRACARGLPLLFEPIFFRGARPKTRRAQDIHRAGRAALQHRRPNI